jgi:hypothetical protein
MPGACGATVKANLNDEAAKFRLALLALIPRLNQSLLSENSSGITNQESRRGVRASPGPNAGRHFALLRKQTLGLSRP